jgi:hypothetical protein
LRRAISAALLAVTALLAVLALQATPASAAPAQAGPNPHACFPGSDADYPPDGPAVQIMASLVLLEGHFVPGGGSDILIGGATPGEYCGLAFSTEFILPLNTADAQGFLRYNDVPTPPDFEFLAMHHIDVFKRQVKVGNFDFCVDAKGDLAPTSVCNAADKPGKNTNTGGSNANRGALPKTGTNHLADLIRVALVLIGVGFAVRYVRRRRVQQQPTA